ncbi:MAG: ABC transporter ATP-binding protein [Chloroflexota bacterium]
MSLLLRCLANLIPLWRIWLPLSVLTTALPLAVLALPLLEKHLLDEVVVPGRLDLLPLTVIAYAAFWSVAMLGQNLSAILRAYLGERLTQHLRRRLFDHCTALSVSFSRKEHSARTMTLFVNDAPMLANFLNSTIILGIASLVTLVGSVALMLALNWQLALATGIAPIVLAGITWTVTRPLRPAARRAQDMASELNERLQEHLIGIREVVAFGRERAQQERFSTTLQELLRLRMRVTMFDTAVQTGQSIFSIAVTIVILGYGSYLIIEGDTTIGTLLAMRTLFSLVFQPISILVGSIGGIQQALSAADRVYEVLDRRPEVMDAGTTRMPLPTTGAVELDNVSFSYVPGQPVLRNISLKAEPGEVIALVGPSGAGKTTLASLIARFSDPDLGRILLDGSDLRTLPLADVRKQIGIVFQDTFLFADTIRANIAFGCESAVEADIIAAARAANAWEIIEQLPDGLDTYVGERGVRLSEGQKQRLAIARALLRKPRILILDEPTSALDARSEHLLQSALENLMRDRTTFVIAHRLATVRRADQILVLDRGRVVETGSHAQLLARGGLYRELFDLQLGGITASALPEHGPDHADSSPLVTLVGA